MSKGLFSPFFQLYFFFHKIKFYNEDVKESLLANYAIRHNMTGHILHKSGFNIIFMTTDFYLYPVKIIRRGFTSNAKNFLRPSASHIDAQSLPDLLVKQT